MDQEYARRPPFLNAEEHLEVLHKFTKVDPQDPGCPHSLWHPEIAHWNVHVTKKNSVGMIDWQGTLIAPFVMQATFPEMFVYSIDVPWCNTNRLPQLPTFLPRIPQKEYQHELRPLLREIQCRKWLDNGLSSARKTAHATPGLCMLEMTGYRITRS
jgi:hypothetical protein